MRQLPPGEAAASSCLQYHMGSQHETTPLWAQVDVSQQCASADCGQSNPHACRTTAVSNMLSATQSCLPARVNNPRQQLDAGRLRQPQPINASPAGRSSAARGPCGSMHQQAALALPQTWLQGGFCEQKLYAQLWQSTAGRSPAPVLQGSACAQLDVGQPSTLMQYWLLPLYRVNPFSTMI